MQWEHEFMRKVLEEVARAAADAGLSAVAPARDDDVDAVAEFQQALGPWPLPEDLAYLWRTADPTTLPMQVRGLAASRARESLESWRSLIAGSAVEPVNFVTVGTGEGRILGTDLLGGGSVWIWGSVGDECDFFAPKVGQWLSVMAAAVADGRFTRRVVGSAEIADVELDVYRGLLAKRVHTSPEMLGTASRRPGSWVGHWTAEPPDLEDWRARQGRPLAVPASKRLRAGDRQPRVTEALDRLERDCVAAGLRVPARASENQHQLSEVAARVLPWPLPDELTTLWSRIEPRTIPVYVYVELLEPLGALELVEVPGGDDEPANLLCVAYEAHDCLAVDIHPQSGGALWLWNQVDGDFGLFARSLGEWIDLQCELLELGQWIKRPGGYRNELFDVAEIELDAYREALARRLEVTTDELPAVPRHSDGWPAHWTPRPDVW
jgi:hypothetical protein